MRATAAFIALLLLVLAPSPALAIPPCVNLEQLWSRINGLKPGSPVSVLSVGGTRQQGVVDSIRTSADGHRIITMTRSDGMRQAFLLNQLDPASFRGPLDALIPGTHFTITSKSGRVFGGEFEGALKLPSGEVDLIIKLPEGALQRLRVSKFDESSLRVKAPVAPKQAPRPAGNFPADPSRIDHVKLPSGQLLQRTSDASYLSFAYPGNVPRGSGRVTRLWKDPAGKVHIEIEELNVLNGARNVRELSTVEIYSARLSATARDNFARFGGPGKAGVPPLAPRTPPPIERPARAPDLLERMQNVRGEFPEGSLSHQYAEGGTLNNRMTPAGRMGTFFNGIEDAAYARRHGRIFDDVSPAQLPRGKKYTYVITDDGRISFGRVDDSWEFGVKHIQIAAGRPVLAAGELQVQADGSLLFNLESGTFTKNIIEQGAIDRELSSKVQSILAREVGAENVKRVGNAEILAPELNKLPSAEELARLCASAEFHPNRHFCPDFKL